MNNLLNIIDGYKNILKSKVNLTSKQEEELFSAREEVCNACPSKENNKCGECGCFIKAKTKAIYAECPLGHW